MYVCLCHGVTDREIQHHLERGADSVAAVAQCTNAGSRCGTCRSTIASMVARANERRRPDVVSLPCLELVTT
jgi:bacterioferritin-associated ferredoxin